MRKYVLDSSAILAFLNEEPGGDRVEEILCEDAVVSTVNQSEIFSKLLESGVPESDINSIFRDLELIIFDFNEPLAWETAYLRSISRNIGLSLGDRACLGLAKQLQLPAVTADRIWASLNIGIEIEVIR